MTRCEVAQSRASMTAPPATLIGAGAGASASMRAVSAAHCAGVSASSTNATYGMRRTPCSQVSRSGYRILPLMVPSPVLRRQTHRLFRAAELHRLAERQLQPIGLDPVAEHRAALVHLRRDAQRLAHADAPVGERITAGHARPRLAHQERQRRLE